MKTKLKTVSCLFLVLISALGEMSFAAGSDQTTKEKIKGVASQLEVTHNTLSLTESLGAIQFNSESARRSFMLNLETIRLARGILLQVISEESPSNKLELILEQASALQAVIAGMLVKKFFGYEINSGPLNINISVNSAVLDILRQELPFLRIGGNGNVSIQSGSGGYQQLKQLRLKFYNLLQKSAAIDSSNKQLKSMANWGRSVDVVSPGQSGESATSDKIPIISFQEYIDLGLKN